MPFFYTSIQASKQMLNSLHSSAKEIIAQPKWKGKSRLLQSYILTDILL